MPALRSYITTTSKHADIRRTRTITFAPFFSTFSISFSSRRNIPPFFYPSLYPSLALHSFVFVLHLDETTMRGQRYRSKYIRNRAKYLDIYTVTRIGGPGVRIRETIRFFRAGRGVLNLKRMKVILVTRCRYPLLFLFSPLRGWLLFAIHGSPLVPPRSPLFTSHLQILLFVRVHFANLEYRSRKF